MIGGEGVERVSFSVLRYASVCLLDFYGVLVLGYSNFNK